MGIRLGSTPITIPGIAKILRGETLIYSSAPAGPVNYTITEKSVLEHETTYCEYSSACKIDDTHFAVAYKAFGTGGIVKTFVVNENLSITEVDRLVHDANLYDSCSLILIDSTHLMLAYSGNGQDGYVKTFSIDGDSDNITQMHSLEFDTSNASYISLVKIDATHYALAYSTGSYYGTMLTLSIDGSYVTSIINKLIHTYAYTTYHSLAILDSSHCVLAFTDESNDGFIKTFEIDDSYNISEIDSYEYDTDYADCVSIAAIDSSHFALVYRGPASGGYLKTFSVDGSFDNITPIDSLQYVSGSAVSNSLVIIDKKHFIVAYADSNDDGNLGTFSVDGSFDNIAQIDTIEHDTSNGTHNALIQLTPFIYALGYRGEGSDGYVKVFELD